MSDEIKWEPKPGGNGLKSPRVDHAIAKRRGAWHLLGGRSDEAVFLSDLYTLDVTTGNWELVEPAVNLPCGIAGHTLVASRGRLHAFGGRTSQGLSSDLWSYDFTAKLWGRRQHERPPSARAHHTAVITNDHRMVVFGGESETPDSRGTLWELDMVTKQWQRVDSEWGPVAARKRHAAILHKGKMLIAGGAALEDGGGSVMQDCWAFDLQNRVWSRLADLPIPVAGAASLVVGDVWVLHGGLSTGGAAAATTAAMDLNSGTWGTVTEIESATSLLPRWGHQLCLMPGNSSAVAVSGGVSCTRPSVVLF